MTYEQIWNTVEDLFNQNLILAKEASKFFGEIYDSDEITTQDGLIIKRRRKVSQENKRREGLYQVSFSSPTKLVNFRIGKIYGGSRESHEYEFDIPDESDMKHFVKYVRDWKLKNLLKD